MRDTAPELVIFDCDGTLVDTEVLVKAVLSEALSELGVQVAPKVLIERFRGGKMRDFIGYTETKLGRSLPESFETMLRVRIAQRISTDLQPCQGAHELLSHIEQKVCVASNAPLTHIRHCLTQTGLEHFFGDQLFSAYICRAWKPDPAVFLAASDALGISPEKCVVIEDSLTGVSAAQAAGMPVWVVGDGIEENGDIPQFPTLDLLREHL
ncbi:HAD family hydrolase [uncultured Ruegeria sp.]|uniref:HAD family hydrolase n=1 Tax=uncultured Ruegeria sp. TaxID=259304 RepID=UPI0026285007|nr:HAD family hydrolase [uncultured Ruegeria sp.]